MLDDVESLAARPHRTVGEWTLPQILVHLARSMQMSFDGAPWRANPIFRWIMKIVAKKRLLYGEERWPTGFQIPKRLCARVKPEEEVDLETAVAEFRAAVARFERERPEAFHPLFGPFTAEEWTKFHLRHAAHHLSHVWPA